MPGGGWSCWSKWGLFFKKVTDVILHALFCFASLLPTFSEVVFVPKPVNLRENTFFFNSCCSTVTVDFSLCAITSRSYNVGFH